MSKSKDNAVAREKGLPYDILGGEVIVGSGTAARAILAAAVALPVHNAACTGEPLADHGSTLRKPLAPIVNLKRQLLTKCILLPP